MTTQLKEGGMLLIPGYRHIQNAQLIIRMEGNGNYTVIHLRENPKPLMVSQTLKYFETQLPDFIRVSKSSLINPNAVDRIISLNAKTMYLQLTDSVRIAVSRRRIMDIKSKLIR